MVPAQNGVASSGPNAVNTLLRSEQRRDTVGARLRALRGEATRDAFGAMIGTSRASLQRYEADERSVPSDLLFAICAATGASADWVLSGVGDPPAGVVVPEAPAEPATPSTDTVSEPAASPLGSSTEAAARDGEQPPQIGVCAGGADDRPADCDACAAAVDGGAS